MLTTNELSGLRDILLDIDDRDLFSIVETVTKRMKTAQNRMEAIEIILSCILTPSDLLKRQKVTKKILFNYLTKRKFPVLAEWDKATLVQKCLEFWGSTELCKASDYIEETKKVPVQMGVEFCKWFFKMLNSLDNFGPEHFWPNCTLLAELLAPNDGMKVSYSNAIQVVTFFTELIRNDRYYFHANESSDSVELEEEEHGLVKVLVHGVLHQHSNCIGLFDAGFGLVKNPEFQYTYKIQFVNIRMKINVPLQKYLPSSNDQSVCFSNVTNYSICSNF